MKNSFSLPDFTSAAKAAADFVAHMARLKAAPFQNLIEI